MTKSYFDKYSEVYDSLIDEFSKNVSSKIGVASGSIAGLVKPHLPVYGASYGKMIPKVAIIGEETNGWPPLEHFINVWKKDPKELINQDKWIFNEYIFTTWANNFGNTFWDTTFKILAKIF